MGLPILGAVGNRTTLHGGITSAPATDQAIRLNGENLVSLDVTITGGTVTVTPQVRSGEGTWITTRAYNITTGLWATTITASGRYLAHVSAADEFRAPPTSFSGATLTTYARPIWGELFDGGIANQTVDTELAAARLLATGLTFPTTADVIASMVASNGTTLDPLRQDSTGALRVSLYGNGSAAGDSSIRSIGTSLDAWAAARTRLEVQVANYLYNGASWDMERSKVQATLLASSGRTTTQTSADIPTYNMTQLIVTLDMTVIGTGNVTVTINGKDTTSGKYSLLLSGAAISSNSTNVYRVGLGNTVTANVSANVTLPEIIQIVVTANNANSATYSVGYVLGRL